MKKIKWSFQALAETVFDLGYLCFAITAGLFMIQKGSENDILRIYGFLALILGTGDAFHLLPRVYALCTDSFDAHYKLLGVGKMITSITMTIFYILLYYIWPKLYETPLSGWLTALVLCLAAVRIILCIIPQNGWLLKQPSFRFAIYRNIPFALLGAIVALLYAIGAQNGDQNGFVWMTAAIVLSFIFYFIVVLFAGKNPKLGMFMIPKTCTYIWMICMGFTLLR